MMDLTEFVMPLAGFLLGVRGKRITCPACDGTGLGQGAGGRTSRRSRECSARRSLGGVSDGSEGCGQTTFGHAPSRSLLDLTLLVHLRLRLITGYGAIGPFNVGIGSIRWRRPAGAHRSE
jgi:hypothetical protein